MCASLLFYDGDVQARAALVRGWQHMVLEGMVLASQDEKTQLGLLNNIYGAGRVMDELNRKGSVRFLGAPDWDAILSEALGA